MVILVTASCGTVLTVTVLAALAVLLLGMLDSYRILLVFDFRQPWPCRCVTGRAAFLSITSFFTRPHDIRGVDARAVRRYSSSPKPLWGYSDQPQAVTAPF